MMNRKHFANWKKFRKKNGIVKQKIIIVQNYITMLNNVKIIFK